MAADGSLLRGEITNNPEVTEEQVEALLAGFMKALLKEEAKQ